MFKKKKRNQKKIEKKKAQLLEVSDVCINCNEQIALDQRFCSHCGGKRIYNRITWRNLIGDFFDRILNIENSFFKTFIAMFRQPEDVIGGYMGGMRKKYLPAFSYFAIALTIAGVYSFVFKHYFANNFIEAQADITSKFSFGTAQKEYTESWIKDWMEFATDYIQLIYFAAIPLLAIISRTVFWNYKKYNFVEHFVIYLYVYSHYAMISSIVYLCFMWSPLVIQILSLLTTLLLIIYTAFVLKRLFNLDSARIILKTGLFGLIIGAIYAMFIILFIIFFIIPGLNKDTTDDPDLIKSMKASFERGKEIGEEMNKEEKKKDSIKHLEDILEVTPEMIKNKPQ